MKSVKFLLSAAFTLVVVAASAQDFNAPQYAKWGDTPEEREKNILNSNFLKESCDNRDYNAAAYYLQELLKNCPHVQESIYQRGASIYKNKINRAKSLAEKKTMIDSLLLIYDLRVKYFGDHPKRGKAYILDQKAREVLKYLPNNRGAIRAAFIAAIDAGGDNTDPETLVAYFSNLCEDYKNTDEVMPETILSEYDRLVLIFEKNPGAGEFKSQFDAAFGLSGAASCENLEKLFSAKLAAEPDNEALVAQAVAMMSRTKCESEFYLQTAEKYYALKPSSELAMTLAGGYQAKGNFDKAIQYLNEALAVEENPAEREKLYVHIAMVELASNDTAGAAAAARSAREINPENGRPYFVLGQCYAIAGGQCGGFEGQTAFWAAYDMMAKAVERLAEDDEYLPTAKTQMASFRSHFPSMEDCHMRDIKEGEAFTVKCGLASGVQTVVRVR